MYQPGKSFRYDISSPDSREQVTQLIVLLAKVKCTQNLSFLMTIATLLWQTQITWKAGLKERLNGI